MDELPRYLSAAVATMAPCGTLRLQNGSAPEHARGGTAVDLGGTTGREGLYRVGGRPGNVEYSADSARMSGSVGIEHSAL